MKHASKCAHSFLPGLLILIKYIIKEYSRKSAATISSHCCQAATKMCTGPFNGQDQIGGIAYCMRGGSLTAG